VTGFDPAALGDPAELRAGLGIGADEKLCLVSVGGSGVGGSLLRRVLDAVPLVRRLVPGLRFLVVTGPRIDPASLPETPGVTVAGYVPDLYRSLAACDLAVVQGGLTTCMELTALRKPFVYVPLRRHFEQNLHVRARLDRYEAGRCLDYAEASDPDGLAEAVAKELTREIAYRPVETDGAARAAGLLAELL
jgi:predicted glycosyltransferase